MQGYREDLAYIHDVGFSDYVLKAAPGLLRLLRRNGVRGGLVVDLGCGGGRWARELNRAGYEVLGVDQSAAMIRLARRLATESRFKIASLHSVELPACDAVTSVGECLNYCFDRRRRPLSRLFGRVFRALRPGGVFLFDIAGPALIPDPQPRKQWTEGPDWAVLVSATGDRRTNRLERRIISFRSLVVPETRAPHAKSARLYRRSEEIHLVQLHAPERVAAELARCGFKVRLLHQFGRFRLPCGIRGMLAVKP